MRYATLAALLTIGASGAEMDCGPVEDFELHLAELVDKQNVTASPCEDDTLACVIRRNRVRSDLDRIIQQTRQAPAEFARADELCGTDIGAVSAMVLPRLLRLREELGDHESYEDP